MALEVSTIKIGAASLSGTDSSVLRERSREVGRLPETVFDEECEDCRRLFVPAAVLGDDEPRLCRRCAQDSGV